MASVALAWLLQLLRVPNKRAGALRLPAPAPSQLSAAAADQQAVVVEALTTAGFAVLVYVNWHCAGVVAAVT